MSEGNCFRIILFRCCKVAEDGGVAKTIQEDKTNFLEREGLKQLELVARIKTDYFFRRF